MDNELKELLDNVELGNVPGDFVIRFLHENITTAESILKNSENRVEASKQRLDEYLNFMLEKFYNNKIANSNDGLAIRTDYDSTTRETKAFIECNDEVITDTYSSIDDLLLSLDKFKYSREENKFVFAQCNIDDSKDKWLKVNEASIFSGISLAQIRRLADKGEIEHIRTPLGIGTQRKISLDSLKSYMTKNPISPELNIANDKNVLLTAQEVAKILKISEKTVLSMASDGRLKHINISNTKRRILRFKMSVIKKFIKENESE